MADAPRFGRKLSAGPTEKPPYYECGLSVPPRHGSEFDRDGHHLNRLPLVIYRIHAFRDLTQKQNIFEFENVCLQEFLE